MSIRPICLSAFVAACLATAAQAQVAMTGSFDASKNCPALQSIRKGTNPGNITIDAGQGYKLLGKNKIEATHFWIEVPGAAPLQRWVAADCGAVAGAVASGGTADDEPAAGDEPFFVLAVSWQPAFCEGKPDKVECLSQTGDRFDASNLSLHGLWPQPRANVFCGVSREDADASEGGRWEDLPDPAITPQTREKLAVVMPGTQSLLERHEWTKHGTCYPGHDAEVYFRDSIRLIGEINASAVRNYLYDHIGQTFQSAELRGKFDEAFGAGAGSRVRVACKNDGNRRLIVELTLGLRGSISAGTPLKDLLQASSPTDPGCPSGIVDAAGLQ